MTEPAEPIEAVIARLREKRPHWSEAVWDDIYRASEIDADLSRLLDYVEGMRAENVKLRGGHYHPFIEGLLQTLPQPNTVWSIEGRASWLEAAATTFKLMYQGEGKITVKAEQPKSEAAE